MNLALPSSGALLLALLPSTQPERTPLHELRRDHVAADAKMVVHVDVDALKATTLYKLVQEHEDDFELDDLEEFVDEYGINPLTDVKSITLYGRDIDDGPTAALIVTNDRLDDALATIREKDGYERHTHGGYELHAFDEEGEDVVAHIVDLGRNERLIVMADDADAVVEAARVVHGKAPSLADDADTVLYARPGQGSFLYVEVAGGMPDEFEPASQVLGLAQGIQFDIGEAGGFLFASAAIATESPDSAMDTADAIDGVMALARLMASADDVPMEVKQVLRSLRVNTRGGQVMLSFEYDVRSLFDIARDLEDEFGE